MPDHRLEFLASENPWSPTAAVAEINERTGAGLELVGLADQAGGTSSAAYVRWPDGRQSALTRTHIPLAWMRRTGEILSALASEGLPVPRHELVIDLSDGRLAVVQEHLPGRPPRRVGRATVDELLAVNGRFAGVLSERRDLPAPPCSLRPGVEDDRLHRVLESHSDRTHRMSRLIREIGRSSTAAMPGNDLVHPDFGLGNVLFDADGRVTGVVDWNGGASRGDHRFALLKLVINIANEGDQYAVTRETADHLDEVLRATIDQDLLRRYWAGWMLHDLHFAIRMGKLDRIETALVLAERHLATGARPRG